MTRRLRRGLSAPDASRRHGGTVPAWALAAALAFALAACSHPSTGASTPLPTAVAVQVATPVRRTFHARVPAFGELAPDARGALGLSLPLAGRVMALRVTPGQRVYRGEELLRYAVDPTARSAWLQASAAVRSAKEDVERAEQMRNRNLATNAQVQAARKALADAQAALRAQSAVGAAQAVGSLLAPQAGVVTAVSVQQGARFPAAATLVQMAADSAVVARLGADPAQAAGIRVGMKVALQPVYGAPGAAPLAARVSAVGGAINPQSHLVEVTATLDAATSLPVGAALEARITTTSTTAWALPRTALQSDAQGDFIFQIVDGKARRVDVRVAAPDGNEIGVVGALDPHAPVVTLGSYELAAGDAVTTRAPGVAAP